MYGSRLTSTLFGSREEEWYVPIARRMEIKEQELTLAEWLGLDADERSFGDLVSALRVQTERTLNEATYSRNDLLIELDLDDVGLPDDLGSILTQSRHLVGSAYSLMAADREGEHLTPGELPTFDVLKQEWDRDVDDIEWESYLHLKNYIVLSKVRHANGYLESRGYSRRQLYMSPHMAFESDIIERLIHLDELVWTLAWELGNLEISIMGGLLGEVLQSLQVLLNRTEATLSPTAVLGTTGEYPDNWDEVARLIRVRDDFRCANCGDTEVELHVHHIVPLNAGGTNVASNLITLCRNCHSKIHPHLHPTSKKSTIDSRRWQFWRKNT